MKKVSVFLIIFTLFSCKSDIEIISSIKQKVIPGLQSVKSYTNFIFKIDVKSDINVTIDSILVIENKQCFQPKYLIKKEGLAGYIDKINSKGTYSVEAAIKEGNYLKLDKCNTSEDKVILFYTKNNEQKKLDINSFITEEKRRR